MHLSRFLNKRGAATKFAARIGVKDSTVSRWKKGECLPRGEQMVLIEEATGGRVKPSDFYTPGRS